MGLGAALAALFLTFVFTVVYAVWCREARDRWAPFEPEPPPPLPNHRPPQGVSPLSSQSLGGGRQGRAGGGGFLDSEPMGPPITSRTSLLTTHLKTRRLPGDGCIQPPSLLPPSTRATVHLSPRPPTWPSIVLSPSHSLT